MSKQNKANKNNYSQSGRLTPDEMARERVIQERVTGRTGRNEAVRGKTPSSGGRAPTRPRSAPEE